MKQTNTVDSHQRDKTRITAKSDRKAHYDMRKERKAGKRTRAAMEWCA